MASAASAWWRVRRSHPPALLLGFTVVAGPDSLALGLLVVSAGGFR